MIDAPTSEGPTIADYVAAVRHRGRLIAVVGLLLALVVALLASFAGGDSATYQASADVLIQPGGETEASPATEGRILRSLPVAQRVEEELNGEISANELLQDTEVIQVPDSNILTVTAEADDPQLAARISNLFAQEYLALSAEQARSDLEAQLAFARDQITFAKQRLSRARQDRSSSLSQRNLLSARIEELSADANVVRRQLNRGVVRGRVVAPAGAPGSPIAQSISPALLAASAGVTGLLLALAFVLLQEHFNDRIRTRSDVGRLSRVPVLAMLHASSLQDDALRLLANDLHHEMLRRQMQALLVTRAPTEIKPAGLVSRVAAHLREADRKVVVVETESEGATVRDPVGSVERAPSPLSPPAAEKLLAELKTEWDTVLIDGPSATSPDAFTLGASADGIVLIVKADRISQSQLARACEHLARTATPLLGTIVLVSGNAIPLREN